MRGLWQVVAKELALFAADRQGAALTVLMPVLLAGLVGMLFAPREEGARAVTLLVVSAQPHPEVDGLLEALRARPGLRVEVTDAAQARLRVAHGGAPAALILPDGAGEALSLRGLLAGARLQATLLQDPSHPFEAGFAAGQIQQALFARLGRAATDPAQLRPALASLRAVLGLTGQPRPALLALLDSADALLRDAPEALPGEGLQLPLSLSVEDVAGAGGPSDYNSYAHTFAGMLCMFLMFGALAAAKGLVEERDRGSLVRLRMAPVAPWVLLLGVAVAAGLIALLVSALVYLAGMVAFGIEIRGAWLGFVAVHLGQATFVGGFALLLAGVGRTPRQIDGLGTFAVLVMSFLGGAWLPAFLMPAWLDRASRLVPTRWATEGLAAMTWRGLELEAGLVPALALVGFGVACGAVGLRAFRWE